MLKGVVDKGMYQKRSETRYIMILVMDCLCVVLSLFIAFFVRYGELFNNEYSGKYMLQMLGISLLVYVVVKLMLGIDYDFYTHGCFIEAVLVLRNNALTFAGITALLYVLKISENYSRLAILYFIIINTILMYILHLILKKVIPIIIEKIADKNRILIIADRDLALSISNEISEMKDFDSKIIGVVVTDDDDTEIAGLDKVADFHNVVEYCQKGYLDEVIIATNTISKSKLKPVMDSISEMGIVVHYHMSVPELTGAKHKTLGHIGRNYMITYASHIASGWDIFIKRLVDIMGAMVGCIILLLLIAVLGPIIKLESPGPIFFAQKRVGRNGRFFKMYKFRSMYVDAEERKQDLMKDNEMDGLMFKMENDPRITKIGRFIRKTSIDEFPQFWNVLKGDMSLVGTRPPTIDEFEQYSPYHKKRLSFRPGITGLWQGSGRNNITDFDEVVSLDVEYIDNWSVWMDFKILLKTVFIMFTGK